MGDYSMEIKLDDAGNIIVKVPRHLPFCISIEALEELHGKIGEAIQIYKENQSNSESIPQI